MSHLGGTTRLWLSWMHHLGPKGLPSVFTCLAFELFLFVVTFFLLFFPVSIWWICLCLKGCPIKRFRLSQVSGRVPLRAAKAKAPSTTKHYIQAPFNNLEGGLLALTKSFACPLMRCQLPFTWSFCYSRVSPTLHLNLSVIMTVTGHTICPCDSKLVLNELETAKREFGKPVLKKGPVTPEMILSICNRLAGPDTNLSDPRLAAACVTAYSDIRCFEVFVILLLGFMYLRTKERFIGMAPMFCWQNQWLCFLPFSRT